MALQVGRYARISYGDELAGGLGVARQQADTGTLVGLRKWESGPSYVDSDISAYRPGTVRPGFEQMLVDLETGKIQGIAVYDLDRLARQPSDLERIIAIYDRNPGLVFATVQGDLQLATSDGRTLARVMVAFANKSSADTARRVSRKRLDHAMNGGTWSTYRPFGWQEDRVTLNEDEAAIIRQATRDVLNGIGLFVICTRLNKQGILTVRGNTWKTSAMRRILNSPRLAGFAIHRGEMLLDEGQPVKGNWQPILEEPQWRLLVKTLEDNRRAIRPRMRGHTYMLSGIARCGICSCPLAGSVFRDTYKYMCRSTDSGGCSGVGINGPKLDAQIEKLLKAYTKDHTPVETEARDWQGTARLNEVRAKISELMDQYNQGLSGGIVFPAIRKLETELAQLEASQTAFVGTQSPAVTIEGQWEDWDLEERRTVIKATFEAIVVKRTGRGGGGYRPERVAVVYRQSPVRSEPSAQA